ncbi:XH/XS domain-containing protein [Perilla frutescens var. frutescens]|nr:XH/XS domain-containing protein [Perilla frutescens var. frutescens]
MLKLDAMTIYLPLALFVWYYSIKASEMFVVPFTLFGPQNAVKNCSLQAAAEEQRKADKKVMRLAEEQKKQKEELHKKIINLEKQLDAKQAVQLEIEQLRGKMNVMKHMGDEEDLEVLNKSYEKLQEISDNFSQIRDLEDTTTSTSSALPIFSNFHSKLWGFSG